MDQQRLGGAVRAFLHSSRRISAMGDTALALVCEWEDGAVEVHYRGDAWNTKSDSATSSREGRAA